MPMSTPPAATRSGSRKIQENPLYPPQPGIRLTGDSRRKQAAAAGAASASPSTTAKTAAKTTAAKSTSAKTKAATAATTTTTKVKGNPKDAMKNHRCADGGAETGSGGGDAETSGDGAVTSDDGAGTPDDGAVTCDDGAMIRDDGTETRDDGAATPNGGATTPNGGAATPNGGAATPNGGAKTPNGDDNDDKHQGKFEGLAARLAAMEERMKRKEEDGAIMKEEVRRLRDRVEEGEWANSQLKTKVASLEVEVTALKKELEEEEKRVKDMERNRGGESQIRNGGGESQIRNGGGESQIRNGGGVSQIRKGGGENQLRNGGGESRHRSGERQHARPKQRCVIITDSNGRGATSDSIKNHIPRGERDNYDIEVAVAFTVEAAFHRVARRSIDVRGATVIVDNLTNDARGTSTRKAVSPHELVSYVDKLASKLSEAGATAMVVCQLKPMQVTNVTPYNELLGKYLRSQGSVGYGCRTQIRLNYLKADGFHVLPQYDSIIDKTSHAQRWAFLSPTLPT